VPPAFGNKAGFVDLSHNETLIPDLPGTDAGAIYKGRSYIFADGMNGADEIVDYSLLDIAVGQGAKPLSWRNRFAQSAREKIDLSFRHRAREGISNALVVFLPFEVPFDQARIEVLCQTDPILLNGTVIAGRIDDATIPKGMASGSSNSTSTQSQLRWSRSRQMVGLMCRSSWSGPRTAAQCPGPLPSSWRPMPVICRAAALPRMQMGMA